MRGRAAAARAGRMGWQASAGIGWPGAGVAGGRCAPGASGEDSAKVASATGFFAV